MKISQDGFLLSKSVPQTSIKRLIDWESLNISKEYIREQSNLRYSHMDENFKFVDKRIRPDNQEEIDRFFVTEMCMPYNPAPDERDTFVYYDDLGPLCGSAGYLRIRDEYVYSQKIYIRS